MKSGLANPCDSESPALSHTTSALGAPPALLWAGEQAWSGRGQADAPLWEGQTDWYLQFSKVVQSSERIGGYRSDLIVLQAPVKMIVKRKT